MGGDAQSQDPMLFFISSMTLTTVCTPAAPPAVAWGLGAR